MRMILAMVCLDALGIGVCLPSGPMSISSPRSSSRMNSIWASSTAHLLTGDSDRAPVRPSVAQSMAHAGADAAGAVLIALHERHSSGCGQHIDVSAQASAAQASLSENLLTANNGGEQIERLAGGVVLISIGRTLLHMLEVMAIRRPPSNNDQEN